MSKPLTSVRAAKVSKAASSQPLRRTALPARPLFSKGTRANRSVAVRAENEGANNDIDVDPKPYFPEQEEDDEVAKLRAAEKFMVIDQGLAECSGCGYKYDNKLGDPEYPISPGMMFSQLPADWTCPICGGPQNLFQAKTKTVAGFAENQGYGLGTNSMTEEEKSLLIYGALFFFFGLFLAGYAFN